MRGSGETRFAWNPEATMAFTGCYGYAVAQSYNAPIISRPMFTCQHCETVTEWLPDERPPLKCWACGAPRR